MTDAALADQGANDTSGSVESGRIVSFPGSSPSEADEKVTVRIDRRDNPLDRLDEADRMRLIIRVLCELVAYGESTEAA